MSKPQPRFIFTEKPPESNEAKFAVYNCDALQGLSSAMSSAYLTKDYGNYRSIITSPPYYRKFDYGVEGQCGLEDTLQKYLEYQTKIARELLRIATPDANLFYVIQDTNNYSGGPGGDHGEGIVRIRGPREKDLPRKSQLLVPERIRIAFAEAGWVPIRRIVWDKSDARHGAMDRPSYSYEEVLVFGASPDNFWNRGAVLTPYSKKSLAQLKKPYNSKSSEEYAAFLLENPSDMKRRIISKMKEKPGAYLKSVWRIPAGTRPRVKVDGKIVRGLACFPLTLAEICVCLGSAPGDTVLDPFSGMGTTLLAAVKWGRNAIGFELNPDFARASIQRIKNAGYANGEG